MINCATLVIILNHSYITTYFGKRVNKHLVGSCPVNCILLSNLPKS